MNFSSDIAGAFAASNNFLWRWVSHICYNLAMYSHISVQHIWRIYQVISEILILEYARLKDADGLRANINCSNDVSELLTRLNAIEARNQKVQTDLEHKLHIEILRAMELLKHTAITQANVRADFAAQIADLTDNQNSIMKSLAELQSDNNAKLHNEVQKSIDMVAADLQAVRTAQELHVASTSKDISVLQSETRVAVTQTMVKAQQTETIVGRLSELVQKSSPMSDGGVAARTNINELQKRFLEFETIVNNRLTEVCSKVDTNIASQTDNIQRIVTNVRDEYDRLLGTFGKGQDSFNTAMAASSQRADEDILKLQHILATITNSYSEMSMQMNDIDRTLDKSVEKIWEALKAMHATLEEMDVVQRETKTKKPKATPTGRRLVSVSVSDSSDSDSCNDFVPTPSSHSKNKKKSTHRSREERSR